MRFKYPPRNRFPGAPSGPASRSRQAGAHGPKERPESDSSRTPVRHESDSPLSEHPNIPTAQDLPLAVAMEQAAAVRSRRASTARALLEALYSPNLLDTPLALLTELLPEIGLRLAAFHTHQAASARLFQLKQEFDRDWHSTETANAFREAVETVRLARLAEVNAEHALIAALLRLENKNSLETERSDAAT